MPERRAGKSKLLKDAYLQLKTEERRAGNSKTFNNYNKHVKTNSPMYIVKKLCDGFAADLQRVPREKKAIKLRSLFTVVHCVQL